MLLTKELYTALAIVLGVNMIISLKSFLPRVNKPVAANSKVKISESVFSWEKAIWLVLLIIAGILLLSLILFFSYVLEMTFVMTIIMIVYFLGQITSSISSVKTVGNIVRGKSSTMLGANDYTAIITMAILVSYLNTYGILDKVIRYANNQTNTILSDWMLLGCYVTSIAITTFFICALTLRPLKIVIELLGKKISNVNYQKGTKLFNKVEKQIKRTDFVKIWTIPLIKYIINQNGDFRCFLWLSVPLVIIMDIFRMILLFGYAIVILIIWYFMCIAVSVGKIFSSVGQWILSLSDRNFVAISFRVAIILGFGCTVIINQYEPFLLNQKSTAVFEFISSTIIIPVILEWVITYKSK